MARLLRWEKRKYAGPVDDLDNLHVDRNFLVGCFNLVIIDYR
jgi:hypothetical protein